MADELIKKLESYLEKSGFPLQIEISSLLDDNKWQVNDCVYFIDQDQKIARELDIHAIKGNFLGDFHSGDNWIGLSIHLIIECKKSSSKPFVFYRKKKRLRPVLEGVKFWSGKEGGVIQNLSGYTKNVKLTFHPNWLTAHHHYFKDDKFAIIYEDGMRYHEENKKNKKTEEQSIPLYDATMKVIKFTDNKIQELIKKYPPYEDIRVDDNTNSARALAGIPITIPISELIPKTEKIKRDYPIVNFFYPIIVLDSKMFEVDIIEGKPKCKPINCVKYFTNYRSPFLQGTFIIDIINKDYFKKFLNEIDMDINAIEKRLKQAYIKEEKK